MIARPSLLYVWLPLALAAYCFATLIDDARKASWRETPAQMVSVVDTQGPMVVRDTLGRPKTRWTSGPSVLQYRYSVDGRPYKGHWNGSVWPLEPMIVLYDPEHPQRSSLAEPPAGTAFHAVGWSSLIVGLTAFGLRRRSRHALAPTPPSEDVEVASGRARTVFRLLILGELAILLIRSGFESAAERMPLDVWDQVDRHLQPAFLEEMFADLYPAAWVLAVLASLGLLSFWRPARQLYVLTWCWWLASNWSVGPSIDFGGNGFLLRASWLLGGAIAALSFYGPIARAFKVRRRPVEETEGRRHRILRARS